MFWRHLIIAILVLLFTAPVAADDKELLARMELELQIDELSKDAYRIAVEKVDRVVKQTSVSKRYGALQKQLWAFVDAYCTPRSRGFGITNRRQVDNICRRSSTDTNRARQLAEESGSLHGKLLVLKAKFTPIVYRQEMKKRLADLSVPLNKDLQERLKRLYKQHST